jgi:hypothetical protein
MLPARRKRFIRRLPVSVRRSTFNVSTIERPGIKRGFGRLGKETQHLPAGMDSSPGNRVFLQIFRRWQAQ